MKKEERIRGKI